MSNPYLSGIDALEELRALIPDTLETRTVGAQEWLRLKLTEVMIDARKRAGLTQKELAKLMGVTQSRISKLENANLDRNVDSVIAYLSALDAECLVAVRQNGEVYQATKDCWLVDIPYELQIAEIHAKERGFEWEDELEIGLAPKNLVLEAAA